MAIAETQVYMPQAPRPRLRLLEDERWLAFVLLVPTMVLLGLFIAYPFVRGILLSVTNSRVGVPGDFVGLANFYKIFNDSIFRTAVYNTFLYTLVTTIFKLGRGLGPRAPPHPHFPPPAPRPRLQRAAFHSPRLVRALRRRVVVGAQQGEGGGGGGGGERGEG